MSITLSALQKQRRDTAANWTAQNPTLLAGEIGIESDTGKIKIGNGSTAWASLAYQGIIPSSGAYPLNHLIMPLGTAAAPSLTFTGDVNTGLYSPGADQISFATGGTERLRIDATGQIEAVSLGTAAAPTFTFTGDPNTGIYSPGADQLAISTNGTGRLFVDASGNVGVGGTASYRFDVTGQARVAGDFHLSGGSVFDALSQDVFIQGNSGYGIIFRTNGANERLRIDTSGRLLVGTSSARSNFFNSTISSAVHIEASSNNGRFISLVNSGAGGGTGGGIILGSSAGTNGLAVGELGIISFQGNDGTEFVEGARIEGLVDGTTGANDMPGRLVFSTTADGASSPTERMRITSAGNVGIGTTTPAGPLHTVLATGTYSPGTAWGTNTAVFGGATSSSGALGINYNDTAGGSLISLVPGSAWKPLTFYAQGHIFAEGSSERARIDSSGRLLVGTSTSINSNYLGSAFAPDFQVASVGGTAGCYRFVNDNIGSVLTLNKSRGTIGNYTVVVNNDVLGYIGFTGADGTAFRDAASIRCEVDGVPGASDMPGRIVLSTTSDGASSPNERLRITNDGVMCYNQPAPTSKSAAATLTVAELKTGIIQYTGAAATLTLPTGTLTEGGFSGIYTNMTFEWSVINTGSGTCTIGAGTDHTIVGGATVAAGASGRFASRRTAANTFVSYRLS